MFNFLWHIHNFFFWSARFVYFILVMQIMFGIHEEKPRSSIYVLLLLPQL